MTDSTLRDDVRDLRRKVDDLAEDVHARPTRAELYTFTIVALAVVSIITGLITASS